MNPTLALDVVRMKLSLSLSQAGWENCAALNRGAGQRVSESSEYHGGI
jgi:hypothetical protein